MQHLMGVEGVIVDLVQEITEAVSELTKEKVMSTCAGGEEEEEEEEEEPRLKYQRMGGSVPSLLSSDAASCISVAERMIALGTHGGALHILDFLGNQVKDCFFSSYMFFLSI